MLLLGVERAAVHNETYRRMRDPEMSYLCPTIDLPGMLRDFASWDDVSERFGNKKITRVRKFGALGTRFEIFLKRLQVRLALDRRGWRKTSGQSVVFPRGSL